MEILRGYCLENHWNYLIVKCLALIKEPKCNYLMVKFLAIYLEMYMESHLGLMLEQRLDIYMYPLMILMITSLRDYCLETNWDLLMGKCLI